jgi:hypothetical protein
MLIAMFVHATAAVQTVDDNDVHAAFAEHAVFRRGDAHGVQKHHISVILHFKVLLTVP